MNFNAWGPAKRRCRRTDARNPHENSRTTRGAAAAVLALSGARDERLNVTGIGIDGDNEGFYVARRYPPPRMNLALITVDFTSARGIHPPRCEAFAICRLSHFQRHIQRQSVIMSRTPRRPRVREDVEDIPVEHTFRLRENDFLLPHRRHTTYHINLTSDRQRESASSKNARCAFHISHLSGRFCLVFRLARDKTAYHGETKICAISQRGDKPRTNHFA